MKNQVQLIIFLSFGLAFLVYLFPFIFVEAAKVESGVTIKEAAPPTNETAPPTNEICNNGIDDDGNGATDEDCAAAPAGPTAGTCGLRILSAVPINYGQLNLDQESAEKQFMIQNQGNALAKIMIKGDDWIYNEVEGPGLLYTFASTITHVAIAPNLGYNIKKPIGYDRLEVGQISSGQSIPVYFQIKPGGMSSNAYNGWAGIHYQTVTIDLLC